MSFEPAHAVWPILPVAASLMIIAGYRVLRRRAHSGSTEVRPGADASVPDRPLLIAFASQSGFAESIAWRTAGALQTAGVPVRLMELDRLDAGQLAAGGDVLFIVSTTGQGDAPDNARAFARTVLTRRLDLRGLRYRLLALGDRSYENFCGFGRRLDRWLRAGGAVRSADLIEVDNADPGALFRWQESLRSLGARGARPDWSPRRYYRWKLAERELLNPGSPGDPIYRIALAPVDTPPAWQAGDIVELFPGPAGEAFAGHPGMPHREYTAASLPTDGRLELVVRQVQSADGRPGRGSGWLTREAAPGELVALRLRENRAFHGPADDRPMILIGNGTGIAGLRAHLKERAARGHARNWLIFGERTAAHDWLFRDEIDAWRAAGHIVRLDAVFSRDQADRIYVQHRLAEAADEVRAWIATGASIYVCGRREGMETGVTATLTAMLGEDEVERLIETRRYCRDVY